VLKTIKSIGADDNTLVIFTSDNGPWLSYGNHAGSAGPLREGKGTCWEGGVRVPFLARWPGNIPAGSIQNEPAMTIDLLPTFAKLVGVPFPPARIDGKEIGALLRCEAGAKNPHEAYFLYCHTNELHAVIAGKWKLMLPHTYRTMAGQEPGKDGKPGRYKNLKCGLELYDLTTDIGETTDVSARHPEIVQRLLAHAESARSELGDALTSRKGTGVRQPGWVN
jgi:arylsulfatase